MSPPRPRRSRAPRAGASGAGDGRPPAQPFELGALLADSEELRAHQQRLGVAPGTLVAAAWCLELHNWLDAIGRTRGINLMLMGGQGAALRMEPLAQRGSADNDYLTSATVEEIQALVEDLTIALEPLAARHAGCFVPRPLRPGPGVRPLALRTWALEVPNLLESGRRGAPIQIKLEFHLEPDLPEGEDLGAAEHFARQEPVRARLPVRPYQVALKLLTLAPEPIGLSAARENAIPRQLYDLDALIARFGPEDWARLESDVAHRYRSETRPLGAAAPSREDVWAGLDRRLDAIAVAMEEPEFSRLVATFQGTQLFRGTQRTPAEWRARTRRVQVAWRIASAPASAADLWQRILEAEEALPTAPAPLTGGALAAVLPAGTAARPGFWEALATASDTEQSLREIAQAASA